MGHPDDTPATRPPSIRRTHTAIRLGAGLDLVDDIELFDHFEHFGHTIETFRAWYSALGARYMEVPDGRRFVWLQSFQLCLAVLLRPGGHDIPKRIPKSYISSMGNDFEERARSAVGLLAIARDLNPRRLGVTPPQFDAAVDRVADAIARMSLANAATIDRRARQRANKATHPIPP